LKKKNKNSGGVDKRAIEHEKGGKSQDTRGKRQKGGENRGESSKGDCKLKTIMGVGEGTGICEGHTCVVETGLVKRARKRGKG